MEFREVLSRRKMIRSFHDRAVEPAVVDRILAAAVRAPSAGHTQGWGFLVLTEPDDRRRFWHVAWPPEERDEGPRGSVRNAGLIIVACADKRAYIDRYAEPDKGWTDRDESRWPIPFWQIDTAFATMSMMLAVVDEDLGAIFFGLRHGEDVKNAFGIPAEIEPIGVMAAGYPAPDVPSPSLSRGRRPASETIHRGRW